MLKKGKRVFAPKAIRRPDPPRSNHPSIEPPLQTPINPAQNAESNPVSQVVDAEQAISHGRGTTIDGAAARSESGRTHGSTQSGNAQKDSSRPEHTDTQTSTNQAATKVHKLGYGLGGATAYLGRSSKQGETGEKGSSPPNERPTNPSNGQSTQASSNSAPDPAFRAPSIVDQQPTPQDVARSGAGTGANAADRSTTQPDVPSATESCGRAGMTAVEEATSSHNERDTSIAPAITPADTSDSTRGQRNAATIQTPQNTRVQPETATPAEGASAVRSTDGRSRRRRNEAQNGDDVRPSIEAPAEKPKRARESRKRKSTQVREDDETGENGQSGEDGEEAEQAPKKRRRRTPTPSDAEDEVIDPTTMKISALCDDLRIGKKFSKHDELRQRQAKKRQMAALAKKNPELASMVGGHEGIAQPEREQTNEATPQPVNNPGLQMRMVNGQIVLEESSMRIDRQRNAAAEGIILEEVEEDDFTRLTTAGTYQKKERNVRWTTNEDEIFYKGLRQFGTDFEMISKMFPYRTRRQIKLRFTSEERRNGLKIKNALMGVKEEIDMEEYVKMTGLKYEEVEDIEEERRKIDEEHKAMEEKEEAELAEQDRRKKEVIREKSEAVRRARAGAATMALGSDVEDEGEEEEGEEAETEPPAAAADSAEEIRTVGARKGLGRKSAGRKRKMGRNAAGSGSAGAEVEILGDAE